MSPPLDRDAALEHIRSTWPAALSEADQERALPAARELVTDWAREADTMPDPAAVGRYQREDLDATIAQVGGDPVKGLELELLKRRVNQLNAATFRLAQEILDGTVPDDESKPRGNELLKRCEQLAAEARDLDSNPVVVGIRRSLEESMLDALFAVERKAMSPRLARARPDSFADEGPPTIRP